MFKATYQYRTKRYKSNLVVTENITVYKKKASSTDVHKSRNHNSKISYLKISYYCNHCSNKTK